MKSDLWKLEFNTDFYILFQVHTFYGAVCSSYQKYINFSGDNYFGGQVETFKDGNKRRNADKPVIKVPCRPLSEYLSMSGLKTVDLFSLDVEGGELEVLRTMNWEVPVGLFMIEWNDDDQDKKRKMQTLLESNGYKNIEVPGAHKINKFFIHPKYLEHISGSEVCLQPTST